MFDLISIGNISIDLFFKGESLTFKDGRFQLAVGGKYFADQFHTSIGGGAANVAIGVAKHGLKTAILCQIGNNPFKNILIDHLHSFDISTKFCTIAENYFNVSCIILNEKGERTIIHHVTPHQHILNDNVIKQLANAKFVYLGNLPVVALNEREKLLGIVRKNSVFVLVNLGVKDCRRAKEQLINFFAYSDIIIQNGHEFAEIVKAPYKDIHFKENIVRWYIPQLQDKIFIITEGEKGSYAYVKGYVYHQPAIKVQEIVDATGAGDGYTAGFIAEYFRSKNIEKAMEKGANYAAKILSKVGAN